MWFYRALFYCLKGLWQKKRNSLTAAVQSTAVLPNPILVFKILSRIKATGCSTAVYQVSYHYYHDGLLLLLRCLPFDNNDVQRQITKNKKWRTSEIRVVYVYCFVYNKTPCTRFPFGGIHWCINPDKKKLNLDVGWRKVKSHDVLCSWKKRKGHQPLESWSPFNP